MKKHIQELVDKLSKLTTEEIAYLSKLIEEYSADSK